MNCTIKCPSGLQVEFESSNYRCSNFPGSNNILYIGILPGPDDEFERSVVFEFSEFEGSKFNCI